MPLPTPKFNIFNEFEALNLPNPLDTGGEWKLISAPTDPVTICASDGSWTALTLNFGDILFPGYYNPEIDFTGGSCAGSPAPDGTYVFEYGIATGDCPSFSEFTIEVQNGIVTLNLERNPEICWLEASTENPDNPSSKEAKVSINADRLCLKLDLRYTVKRKQFLGCAKTVTTLTNDLKNYGDLQITTANLPRPLGHPTPLLKLDFTNVPGLFVFIRYRISLAGWLLNGYIDTIRTGRNQGAPPYLDDLDLSSVKLTGTGPTQKQLFGDALRTKIATELTALGAGQTNACFFCQYDSSTDELKIDFMCANVPSGAWYGIDKTNWEVVFYPDPGGPVQIENNAVNGTYVWLDTFVLNQFDLTQCYEVFDISFYQDTYNDFLCLHPYFCTSNYSNIYNLTSCNFVNLVLKSGTKSNIFDADTIACSF